MACMRVSYAFFTIVAAGLALGLTIFLWPDNTPKRIMAEYQHYKSAVEQFEYIYDALPGDMPYATAIWGLAGGKSGTDEACYSINSRKLDDPKRTCDGNGNGKVYHEDNAKHQTAPEWYRAWQHLANAGLIEGTFSGKAFSHPREAQPDWNVPASKAVEGAGYTLMYFDQLNHPAWFPGRYFGFAFGVPFVNPLNLKVETRGGAISPQQAYAMDVKFDDANPRGGIVRSFRDLIHCLVPDENRVFSYNLTQTVDYCGLFLAFSDPGYETAPMKRWPRW